MDRDAKNNEDVRPPPCGGLKHKAKPPFGIQTRTELKSAYSLKQVITLCFYQTKHTATITTKTHYFCLESKE